MEDYLHLNSFYDCHGMKNVFLLKFRISQDGNVSVIPKEMCPPFPSFIESFSKLWSLCYCELIFNSIHQIQHAMQHILCRVAQSQGDFAVKNVKLQFPSCCWFYIKSQMQAEGVQSFFLSDICNHAAHCCGVSCTNHVSTLDLWKFCVWTL